LKHKNENDTVEERDLITMEQYVKKLFHVCITVEDIEEALAFYSGVLGMHSIGSLRNEKSD